MYHKVLNTIAVVFICGWLYITIHKPIIVVFKPFVVLERPLPIPLSSTIYTCSTGTGCSMATTAATTTTSVACATTTAR